jgi:hypothetical protein
MKLTSILTVRRRLCLCGVGGGACAAVHWIVVAFVKGTHKNPISQLHLS